MEYRSFMGMYPSITEGSYKWMKLTLGGCPEGVAAQGGESAAPVGNTYVYGKAYRLEAPGWSVWSVSQKGRDPKMGDGCRMRQLFRTRKKAAGSGLGCALRGCRARRFCQMSQFRFDTQDPAGIVASHDVGGSLHETNAGFVRGVVSCRQLFDC